MSATPPSRRTEFMAAVRDMVPLEVGGVPFGIIFGALAVTNGLSPWAALGMSMFVFAGSSQFIATGLIAQGAAIPVIVLTTFVVNLRHTLYAATLAPHVRHLPQRWLLPLAATLTDESFVMTIARYERGSDGPHTHWYFLGANLSLYVMWQLSTVIGIVFGAIIPDSTRLGLDFAMSATFIGMLVPMLKHRPAVLSVLVAAVTAVVAYDLPNQLGLFLAAILGVVAGVLAEKRWPLPVAHTIEAEAHEEAEIAIAETRE